MLFVQGALRAGPSSNRGAGRAIQSLLLRRRRGFSGAYCGFRGAEPAFRRRQAQHRRTDIASLLGLAPPPPNPRASPERLSRAAPARGEAIPLLAAGAALVIIAAALVPYAIPLSHTFDILLEQVGLGQAAAPDTEQAIVSSVRLPRIVLALIVGAALAVAGAVMQGLFRNPMAAPGIIGVSTGGALGAVVAIATGA